MPWIPLALAELYVKNHWLKEGDQFVRNLDGPTELYVNRNGKPEATGYIYRPDENAFVKHFDYDPDIV